MSQTHGTRHKLLVSTEFVIWLKKTSHWKHLQGLDLLRSCVKLLSGLSCCVCQHQIRKIIKFSTNGRWTVMLHDIPSPQLNFFVAHLTCLTETRERIRVCWIPV